MEEKQEKSQESQENKEKDNLQISKEKFTEELNALREKYGLDLLPTMDFFEYKVLPEEVQLALLILNKHKVRYVFNLVEVKKDDN